MQAAASKAFWNLTIVSVKPFAEERGVDLGANSSLCDVLFDIIKKEFKCTDAQAMQLVSQRLGVNDLPCQWANSILEVEDASSRLTMSDAKILVQDQEHAENLLALGEEFQQSYRSKLWDMKAEAQAKAGAAKGKKKAVVQKMHTQTFLRRRPSSTCPQGHQSGGGTAQTSGVGTCP